MPFCFNCGQQLDDNAKVCFSCGTARPEQQIDDENYSQRKNEYIGKIKKCPSCGAEIKSFVGICPECGHEINESSVSPTLSIFSEKVNWFDNKIDSFSEYRRTRWVNWQLWQQILWIILNIYTYGIATLISSKKYKKDLQHKKESFIESYVVPNDRESIIELLLFIKMQISSIISNKGNKNANRWLIIWKNKAEQVYQKSEIMFSGDKIANDAINYIRENCDAFIDKSIKRNKIHNNFYSIN